MNGPELLTRRILVVDDDPGIALLLQQLLRAEGHLVQTVADGRDAMAAVTARPPDLILTDLDMPRLDGYELCRWIKSNPATRLIPVVVITGQHESSARLRAWELGADEFLTKPFHTVEVLARCRALLRLKQLLDELESAETVIFSLARALEAKSPYTWGHSERVTQHVLALARQLGLSDADQMILWKGAILHDIGKIGIPDAILNKPGRLTPEEFALIQSHPLAGVRIVESLRSLQDVIPLIRWHHERMDGGGYPDGLFAATIPLLARILAVADVFDALHNPRPYRPALPTADCLQLLRASAASGGLDPELVHVFCEVVAPVTAATREQ
jgi:putative two-component system response regulator